MQELTTIKTGRPEFDEFYPRIKAFIEQDTLDMTIDGRELRGYRSPDTKSVWIRDYSDMMRGFKYFECDLKSVVEHFAETQAQNGRLFDYVTTFPEKLPCEKENWTKYVRVPVEADVEFRFIKAAFMTWQCTGDDDWLQRLLPHIEKALEYIMTHPWRWDQTHQLVKRPYTIDTWDFAYTAGRHDWLQFQITDDTYWGIMHGDNSGYYESFQVLAFIYDYFNVPERATYWQQQAAGLQERMNKVCWNGRFYTHFVKLNPVDIPDCDEAEQLSLSNPMNINRGVATHEMAVSIINEYRRRRDVNNAFAEWFSIDPPFPDGIFGDEVLKQGAYCNGGIMPLVGGELAKAMLDHGFERQGIENLKTYYQLISEKNETYLWYFPDGTASSVETSTSPDATPTDGWGSSAMLYAFIEGLVGIENASKLFKTVNVSPRWAAADVEEAEVSVGYRASETRVGYYYRCTGNSIDLEMQGNHSKAHFHLLLPRGRRAEKVTADGKDVEFVNTMIEQSAYVDFKSKITAKQNIKIQLK